MSRQPRRDGGAATPPLVVPIIRRYTGVPWCPPRRARTVDEAMRPNLPFAVPGTPVEAIRGSMERHALDLLAVTDDDGRFLGAVRRQDVDRHTGAAAADLLVRDVARLSGEQSLDAAARTFAAARAATLPVVSPDGRLEGLLLLRDLVAGVRPRRRRPVLDHPATIDKLVFATGIALGLTALLAASGDATPFWVSSLEVTGAGIALIASAPLRASATLGLALLPFLSISLVALFFLCRALDTPSWLTWAQLAFAVTAASLAALGASARTRRRGGKPLGAGPARCG